jgi:predicted ArsR family transcriptional regulator
MVNDGSLRVAADRHTDPAGNRVGARRGLILRTLGENEALSAEQIAEIAGIHVNTARFHLKRLVEDGLATESTVQTGTRGRPQAYYRARLQRAGKRSYLMLAEMLGDVAATAGAAPVADVGRSWGLRLAAELGGANAEPDGERSGTGSNATIDTERVAAQVEAVMDSIGFDPQVTVRGSKRDPKVDVELRHCPFLEVASRHPRLVCGMHQNLLQGVLDGLSSGLRVHELEPFVTPDTCVARLRR